MTSTSYRLKKKGAHVVAADLFPQFFKLPSVKCQEVDLTQGLPYGDNSFDLVICQEGIEHFENQLFVLQELARVLKKGGQLLLTTPSFSHLRARLSYFLCESDYYKRSAPNELDSVWFSEKEKDRLYYGHIFLINALKLRTLACLSGFRLKEIYKTNIGTTSLLLFPLFYPFIILFNLMPFIFYARKLRHIESHIRTKMMFEQFLMQISPKTLLCKHTMNIFVKDKNASETIDHLKKVTRN